MLNGRTRANGLLLACLFLAAVPGRTADLTPDDWKKDLDFLSQELPKRHMNLFFRLTSRQWDEQVRHIAASLPTLSDVEARTALH